MPEKKEWTLMFYLASDNPIAPGVISQLKAIKSAGYHPDVNVVTQFDPYVEGVPTHVFDVNLLNKIKHPGVADIGFQSNDPFVRNLIEDKLWREQKTRDNLLLKKRLREILERNHGLKYEAPIAPEDRIMAQNPGDEPEEPDPQESLKKFLSFCANQYPARRYALFILGHGVVVGNDVFLYDEHASTNHSLTLTQLGCVLRNFRTEIDDRSEFELISFHSCSVSSVEVAYELKDTANYMLASQGPAFVGSWPYRAILIRIFNDLPFGRHLNVKEMLRRIAFYCLFNSVDFLLAGYSFQVTLCDLRLVGRLTHPMQRLAKALTHGLDDLLTKDVILLSHLKSQSFYKEMYTDLYDFCFCICNKVLELKGRYGIPPVMRELDAASNGVMDVLVKEFPHPATANRRLEQIIVSAEYVGPSYQYSRGLSVYFPWAPPAAERRILREYAQYKFHTEVAANQNPAWLTFLQKYFDKTRRAVSSDEADRRRFLPKLLSNPPTQNEKNKLEEQKLYEDMANLVCGAYSSDFELALDEKTGPRDPTGGNECDCASIKNFPRDTRPRRERIETVIRDEKKQVQLSQAVF